MATFREYLEYSEKCITLAEDKAKESDDINWLLMPSAILS